MTKQARTLDAKRLKQALAILKNDRESVMLLLSVKAGLRAKEIAGLTWEQVDLDDRLLLLKTTKGDKPRNVPIAVDLLEALKAYREGLTAEGDTVLTNEHNRPGAPLTANSVAAWFSDLYKRKLGWSDYSSHSGRRTFVTQAARKIVEAGGSLKDVQALAGHADLKTTSGYIEQSEDAQRKVVDLI
jgi:integrase/recombinase XerD